MHRVEEGLLPAVVIEGRDTTLYTIYERMDRFNVPGVGISVIRDGQLDWSEGYGIVRAGGTDSIHAATRFQAASISKPVAAAGVRQTSLGALDLRLSSLVGASE